MKYLLNILKLFDNAVNVFFGPFLNWWLNPEYKFGYYRDPLSEVFGRNLGNCKVCIFICKVLSFFENGHCKKAIKDD